MFQDMWHYKHSYVDMVVSGDLALIWLSVSIMGMTLGPWIVYGVEIALFDMALS